MPVDMGRLAGDLVEETRGLRELVGGLPAEDWDRPTPAVGWAIRDQVGHLAYFDDATVLAATDPEAFRAARARLLDAGLTPDDIAARYRSHPPARLLDWFDAARARLVAVAEALDPGGRLPWYGPPLSAASSVTARIMETWAHGYDVADALGVVPEPTDRLRHVAHIGVATRGFGFTLHGLAPPDEPVRVELVAPSGASWTWGPADAPDRVTGPALDFALLVTQRRHRDDLDLRVTGAVADRWLSLAQAFAGAPGSGRAPTGRRPPPPAPPPT